MSINSSVDINDGDFSREPTDRKEAERYLRLIPTGDARLDRGLFRTESEEEARREMALKIKLPRYHPSTLRGYLESRFRKLKDYIGLS